MIGFEKWKVQVLHNLFGANHLTVDTVICSESSLLFPAWYNFTLIFNNNDDKKNKKKLECYSLRQKRYVELGGCRTSVFSFPEQEKDLEVHRSRTPFIKQQPVQRGNDAGPVPPNLNLTHVQILNGAYRLELNLSYDTCNVQQTRV